MSESQKRSLIRDKIHFAVLAIEATAEHERTTPKAIYNRLKKVGLLDSLIFGCYDTLHCESIEGVVWNVTEALKNWEKQESEVIK